MFPGQSMAHGTVKDLQDVNGAATAGILREAVSGPCSPSSVIVANPLLIAGQRRSASTVHAQKIKPIVAIAPSRLVLSLLLSWPRSITSHFQPASK